MTNAPICPLGSMERLVVATDRSEYSEGAIREAINFAQKCSSSLTISTVLESNPEYETIGSKFFEQEEKEALAYLDSLKIRASNAGLACETVVLESDSPYRALVDLATDKKFDMIVVGRRGRKGFAKLLIGEVASKIIGHVPCKVLVVPRAARIEYRSILIATDGSMHGNAAVIEAIAIAKRCASKLIVLSSIRSNDEAAEAQAVVNKVVQSAQQDGISTEALTPLGKSHEVIIETASGRGVDLIVMGNYGKTGVKKLLMGSSTEKVIRAAGCAVLVVKA